MAGFTLSSKQFTGQVPKDNVYDGFGAGGDNHSPDLNWTDAPDGTKSFLIICHDTDAPGPGGWWHWCAFDIPASVSSLPSGASKTAMPEGSQQTLNSYGSRGFGGACPPPGDPAHPYVITLYALGTDKLGLGQDASPAMVLFVAAEHVLGKAGVTAYYGR